MEDKVINIEEEIEDVVLNLKTGEKIPAKAKTTYTYYESGRKDCKIEIEKPISLLGEANKTEE